jgi:tetratricopeptide (TPR) repeat protein
LAKQARRPIKPSPHHHSKSHAETVLTASAPSNSTPVQSTTRRTTYGEAVGLYEQGVRTLQLHNYAKAADLLRHLIDNFAEERELVERARMYLTLCERQMKPLTAEPQNTAERLYAATLALNAGRLDEAATHLNHILEVEPSHDQALYMLAVNAAARTEVPDAIRYLRQAIAANAENRALARMDPDLDSLRQDAAVAALLDLRYRAR